MQNDYVMFLLKKKSCGSIYISETMIIYDDPCCWADHYWLWSVMYDTMKASELKWMVEYWMD